MTLKQIRQSTTIDQLKPAIVFLCDNMQKMAWGEFNAYRRTLEIQGEKLGLSVKTLNELAETYQVFGYFEGVSK